uniref:Major facilitator superfamily domain containing 4A n=1 Tax=Rousettus aegyptiacus TaxID=9407 RepID=A0A7J8BFR3_ROUAE|nr:major facilitator superfamily domain containing 4A [Rousettus aegyptiacus]
MGCDGRLSGLLRRNLQPTLTYWSVFFSFGLCIAFLGPTLLDLRCQTHSSLSQISWVFFSQQLCLLLGSALGGVFKRTNVKVLASVMALAGLAMGCIDTVANMQLVRIYQKDSAVFLQVTPQRAWGCVAGRALCICPPLPSHTPRGSLSWPLGQGGDAERALASQFS